MDRDKVIKGIQECDLNGGLIGNCPYKGILALLKEQEETIKNLEQEIRDKNIRLKERAEQVYSMLKEQDEETRFVYDEYITPMCEKCTFHPFAGYIPTIKWMQERGYMKCPRCGRSINW